MLMWAHNLDSGGRNAPAFNLDVFFASDVVFVSVACKFPAAVSLQTVFTGKAWGCDLSSPLAAHFDF